MCKLVSRSLGSFALTLLIAGPAVAQPNPLPENLAETLDLYLSSDSHYRELDLITESQLLEFQVYLRRTRGGSLATHPRWARKALSDGDPLVKLFYNGGAALIRATSEKAGGYAELQQLAHTPRGREVFKSAIKENKPSLVLEAINARRKKQVEASSASSKQKPATTKSTRIFTAQDYIAAVTKAYRANKNRQSGDSDKESKEAGTLEKPENQ